MHGDLTAKLPGVGAGSINRILKAIHDEQTTVVSRRRLLCEPAATALKCPDLARQRMRVVVEPRNDAQVDIKKRAAKDQVVAQGDIKRLENCAAKIEPARAATGANAPGLGCTSPRLLRRLLRLTRVSHAREEKTCAREEATATQKRARRLTSQLQHDEDVAEEQQRKMLKQREGVLEPRQNIAWS